MARVLVVVATPVARAGDAGYHAVAIDLPGYGRSDKPEAVYDEEWVNACIAGAIPALGHRQAVIVGHDWGGLPAWPSATRWASGRLFE